MEVRWFLRGDVPQGTKEWFVSGSEQLGKLPYQAESREDIYLYQPDAPDLGVKLRAGDKLEVKQRREDKGMSILRAGIEGRVEQWTKWSFNTPEKNEKGETLKTPDITKPEGTWITMEKQRILRKYEINEQSQARAVDADKARPAQGCNLEITVIRVAGQIWWSLGFESFGELVTVEKNLKCTLELVLADPQFPQMNAVDSYSFPAWIRQLYDLQAKNYG